VWRHIIEHLSALPEFSGLQADPYVLHLGFFEASTVVDRRHQTILRKLHRRFVYAGSFAHWRWRLGPLEAFTTLLTQGSRNKLRLFDVIAESEGRSIVIDSSKHYLEALSLYKSAPSRTRIILLIRDGRAVFFSGLKRGHGRRRSLNAWLRTYRRAIPVLESHVPSAHRISVRYEYLAADPARELHRLCAFIGMRFEQTMLDFRARQHHLLSGNEIRLSGASEIRADESWREHLSSRDLSYFEARAGELNAEMGYR
jgi:hypothetical protein